MVSVEPRRAAIGAERTAAARRTSAASSTRSGTRSFVSYKSFV
jgi:hypothetical protein